MGVVDIDELRKLRGLPPLSSLPPPKLPKPGGSGGPTFNMDTMRISAVDITWHGEDATVTISFDLPPEEAKALLHKARDIMFKNNRRSK